MFLKMMGAMPTYIYATDASGVYVNLFVGSRASLPHIAGALLRDPERLRRIRVAAYDRLRTWMPYALPVSVLRAAIVELVGEPVTVVGAAGGERAGVLSAR